MKLIIAYLIIMNLIGFIIMGIDKSRAKKHSYRISERALISIAAIGGSAGIFAGMQVFHHKTKHKKFSVGVPLIIVLQIIAAALMYIFIFSAT